MVLIGINRSRIFLYRFLTPGIQAKKTKKLDYLIKYEKIFFVTTQVPRIYTGQGKTNHIY
ncbi:MAG: hypothetical protein CL670_14920 [Balneola sp.]|jgi:hypothetical protein|nr:hypothetical protein [Balneola sp.]MBE80449.1 hypothetical protein [Balneola sp.]HAD51292.1 hypothetical protein [Algoriphagus sp.]